ncbi:MAG: ATP-binding protein [Chloroflexota bacterium]
MAQDRSHKKTIPRESEPTYRMLVESSPDGILTIGSGGNIIDCNAAFCKLTGFEREKVRGKGIDGFIAGMTPQKLKDYQALLRDSGQLEDELKTVTRYCRVVPLQAKLVAINDSKGELYRIFIYLRDVSEQGKLDELENEFIGLVSHELRTPLTVITGCLGTVLTEWEHLPPEETQQLLRDAVLESESLSHLIDNLLELSRSQAGQLKLYLEPTNIRELVVEAVDRLKKQYPSHKFITSIPSRLPLIDADPSRIGRILRNLLGNAAKYSAPESRIKVSIHSEPERMVLSVSDQGRGLSPAEQSELFRPFQRLRQADLDSIRGIGLGLLVCQRLVVAHGGEIWVDSAPGKGSTFSFTLPYPAK